MPELPEVETIRCGLQPLVVGKRIDRVIVRTPKLRWPIPRNLSQILCGQVVRSVERRAKYLVFRFSNGSMIIHLGMSGRLRVISRAVDPGKHDHVDIVFHNGTCLRFCDPRRFGALLWSAADPLEHPLLFNSGPEPLTPGLNSIYLHERSRGRKVSVKQFIMDQRVVSGVGNIYANEALFMAGIHPLTPAGRISRKRYQRLASAIKKTLRKAIAAGGTTVRDFQDESGDPGYFQLQLKVYGRGGKPCFVCGHAIRCIRNGQRSTFYCPKCQR
jgi:formamidopyrimidine-DNA glycosylase